LQSLQPGTQGHLLLKTENGQYQLLRVGPAPTTPGAAIAPNSAAATLPAGATYRLQSVPSVSRLLTDAGCQVAMAGVRILF
jgi:transcription initiation factor TFIID subunit 4